MIRDNEGTDCFERARQALKRSPIRPLRMVEVDRLGRAIVLTGKVDSFYHKQLAQELVRTVARDVELVNSIHVR